MFLKHHSCILLTLLSSVFLLHGMSDENKVKREKCYYDYNGNESNPYLEEVKMLKGSELEGAAYIIFDWRKKEIVILKNNFDISITNSSRDIP